MIRYSSKYLFKRFSYRVAFFYKQKLSLITILSYFLIALFQGIWFNSKSLNLYNSLAHRRERRDRRGCKRRNRKIWEFSPLFYYFSAFSAPFAVNYYESIYARVVELADTPDSKSGPRHRG